MADLTPEQKNALVSLIEFGYLDKGKKLVTIDADITRAITRFQRHAARPYRLPQDTPNLFHGAASGVLDAGTLAEVDKWKQQGWKLPLGRFKLVKLAQGDQTKQLRSDAAAAWDAIVTKVTAAGGTLEGPYGDTVRAIDFKGGAGSSRYSFHYAGRAVDISQPLGGGRNQRYYIEKDPQDGKMYWRIWCKTAGGKGTAVKAREKTYFDLFARADMPMPAGTYVDITKLIEESGQFERIRAQAGWEGNAKKTEWWHFQYTVDKQATIQDELELIGKTEAELKRAGWSLKDLDHAPG